MLGNKYTDRGENISKHQAAEWFGVGTRIVLGFPLEFINRFPYMIVMERIKYAIAIIRHVEQDKTTTEGQVRKRGVSSSASSCDLVVNLRNKSLKLCQNLLFFETDIFSFGS